MLIRLRGAEFVDIFQHASENKWGVTDRQIRNYIAKADDLLEETLEKDRRKLMNRHLAQRRTLFAAAFAAADYSTARAVLKDEADLLDLYPAKKTEVTGANGGPVRVKHERDLSDAELLAIIAESESGSSPNPAATPAGPGPSA